MLSVIDVLCQQIRLKPTVFDHEVKWPWKWQIWIKRSQSVPVFARTVTSHIRLARVSKIEILSSLHTTRYTTIFNLQGWIQDFMRGGAEHNSESLKQGV